jgi:hypothetical protein
MIKTDNLNEYVLLSVLKNFCEATINDSDCSECKMNAVCDYGLGSKPMKKLDIKYEPDDKNNINDITVTYLRSNKNAEEKQ